MQLLVEQVFGGVLLAIFGCGIVGEDGSSGETEHLVIAEKVDDTFVSVAELAAVTFIEDEDDPFITQLVPSALSKPAY